EMSYLVVTKLLYGVTRAQESGPLASTCSVGSICATSYQRPRCAENPDYRLFCGNDARRDPPRAGKPVRTIANTHDCDQNRRVDTPQNHNKMLHVPPRKAAHFIFGTHQPVHIRANMRQRDIQTTPVTSHLMPTFARVDLAFERGEGA